MDLTKDDLEVTDKLVEQVELLSKFNEFREGYEGVGQESSKRVIRIQELEKDLDGFEAGKFKTGLALD